MDYNMIISELRNVINRGLTQGTLTNNSPAVMSNGYDGKTAEINAVVEFLIEMPNNSEPSWIRENTFNEHPYWSTGKILSRRLKVIF